jgi:hypothetical protein
MKQIKHTLLFAVSLALLGGCEKLEEITVAAPEDVVAPVLQYTHGDIVVSEGNLSSGVATFSWQPADFGVAAAIQYVLYVKVGSNNPVQAASAYSKSVDVKYADLNTAVLRAGAVANTPNDISAYLEASISNAYAPTQSNTLAFKVTPLEVAPPPLHLAGTVLGDPTWSDGNFTFVFFREENMSEEETMTANFLAGEFKLIPDNADGTKGGWGLSYGSKGGSGSELTSDDGGNIAIATAGYYTIVANIGKLTYSITPYNATGKPTYTSVAFGSAALTQTAYDSHIWTAEDVTLTAGDERKFVTSDGAQFGAAGFPYGKATAGGDAVRAQEGNYFVKFNDLTGHYVFYKNVSLGAITPPVLTGPAPPDPIVVSSGNRADKVTFTWSGASFGVATDITYTLYARIGANGDAHAVPGAAVTNATSCEVTYGALSEAALAAGITTGTAADVQLFVRAAITAPREANSESNAITVSITPVEFTYPAAVYMIGQDFGNWEWNSDGVVEMTPVHSHDGQFWCVRYFTAGKGFKWNTVRDWSGDFSSLGTGSGFTVSGGNAEVADDGFYSVYIDYTTSTITIEPAQVYGMGDCFGGWGKGAYPFTADGTVMKITTTSTEAKELRMYAASSGAPAGVDWWQMEFIILDGKIEYRGAGNDQTRVSVDAGKTVTLDFNAGTGAIQ